MTATTSTTSCQIIQPSRYEETMSFCYDNFLLKGPLGKALFDSAPQRNPAFDKLLLTCLQSNLSWCALSGRDGENGGGEIIGVLLSSSVDVDDLPDDEMTYNGFIASGATPQLASVLALWNEILDLKQLLIQQKQSKLFYMQIGCVHDDYMNTRIGTDVFVQSMEHAIAQGYSLITSISTSYYTQKVFEKNGFRRIKEIKYSEYVVNGKTVFKNVEQPHQSAVSYYITMC